MQNIMTLEELKDKLSEEGSIQIIKEGFVFTLLMTGEGLGKMSKVRKIQDIVLEYVVGKYPIIEAMRNDDNFYCIVLRPRT